jgi:hypothetical protein
VRKKRILWVGLGLIALVVAWFGFLRPRGEPKYQGRYLSEWLADCSRYSFHQSSPEYAEAKHAIQYIGTNAFPCYLKWLRYEPVAWQRTLYVKLPDWVREIDMVSDWLGRRRVFLQVYTAHAFHILGTNAVGAIPDLAKMLKDRTKPNTVYEAIQALRSIGEPAIPVLEAALVDTNQFRRVDILQVFQIMADRGHSNSCVPILLKMVNDENQVLRREARLAIHYIAPHLLTNAPAE